MDTSLLFPISLSLPSLVPRVCHTCNCRVVYCIAYLASFPGLPRLFIVIAQFQRFRVEMEVRRYTEWRTYQTDIIYMERAAIETTMWGSLRLAPIMYVRNEGIAARNAVSGFFNATEIHCIHDPTQHYLYPCWVRVDLYTAGDETTLYRFLGQPKRLYSARGKYSSNTSSSLSNQQQLWVMIRKFGLISGYIWCQICVVCNKSTIFAYSIYVRIRAFCRGLYGRPRSRIQTEQVDGRRACRCSRTQMYQRRRERSVKTVKKSGVN